MCVCLTVRMACHSPTSFLKSNTFTMVSAAGRQKQHIIVNTARLSLRIKLKKPKCKTCVLPSVYEQDCVRAWQCVSMAILITVTPRTLPSLQVLYWTDRVRERGLITVCQDQWLTDNKKTLLENEVELWSSSESFSRLQSVCLSTADGIKINKSNFTSCRGENLHFL